MSCKNETSVMDVSEIKHIQFGILSVDEIERNAVCIVDNTNMSGPGSVYDERMGVTESGRVCLSCGQTNRQCPGHYGCIKLTRPIFHPMYYRHAVAMLNLFCSYCSRLYTTEEHLLLERIVGRMDKISEYMAGVCMCAHCGQPRRNYMFLSSESSIVYTVKSTRQESKVQHAISADEALSIFASVKDSDVRLLGINPENMRPRSLVMEYVVVIPTKSRPYIISDGTTCDDDMTVVYQSIVRNNEKVLTDPSKQDSIVFLVTTLMNNSDGRSKHNNGGRPIKGIKERISGKDGIIRNNMSGKRVNQSARTVIGPDPTLCTDEVAVPEKIAAKLTVPETVNSLNIHKLQEIVDLGKANYVLRNGSKINLAYACVKQATEMFPGDTVFRGEAVVHGDYKQGDVIKRGETRIPYCPSQKREYKICLGDTVERHLHDGDIILINRQPTLHKCSMLAKRVVVRPGKTMRLNLATTKVFNADFDGDEMNIHVPQDYVARAELSELVSTGKNVVSAQSSRPHISIVQDGMLGAYLMTKNDYPVPTHIFNDICMSFTNSIDVERIADVVSKAGRTGRALVSLILPGDFTYRTGVDIRDGVLYSGAVTKSVVASIIHTLYKDYSKQALLGSDNQGLCGTSVVMSFVNNIQFAAYGWLQHFGFSIGLGDCIPSAELEENVSRTVAQCFAEAARTFDAVKNSRWWNPVAPRIRDAKVAMTLAKARDRGMKIAKDSLSPDNGFVATVTSGSKGDYFNVCQITGLLGQQNVSGKPIQPMLNEKTRALPHFPFETGCEDFTSTGFVTHSFIRGLKPHEYFFHAMSGREGVSDTALKTAVSGYTQRKMVKMLEDIQVKYDGTVRNSAGEIIQWEYAADGLDRTETILRDGESDFCDIARLVDRLNAKI
jgi:DNA-directed RNA polymerase beta' subunit